MKSYKLYGVIQGIYDYDGINVNGWKTSAFSIKQAALKLALDLASKGNGNSKILYKRIRRSKLKYIELKGGDR